MKTEAVHQAANAVSVNGWSLEEFGLMLRAVISESQLRIGEVARAVQRAIFGGNDAWEEGDRPDVFPLPVPTQSSDAIRLITVLKNASTREMPPRSPQEFLQVHQVGRT